MSTITSSLSDLLDAAKTDLTETALNDLIHGIAAAPEGHDPGSWHFLVTENPTKELLLALKNRIAEIRSKNYGLEIFPTPPHRVSQLREELQRQRLDGIIIPRGDEHQGEYVAARSERLTWVTGLTASAGLGIVLINSAAVFVDGRYILQTKAQVNGSIFERRHITNEPADEWIADRLPNGGKLGYDPWLLTPDQVKRYKIACKKAGGTLVAVEKNPVDAVWDDQPPPPIAPVWHLNDAFTGETATEKQRRIAALLKTDGVDAALLTAPDSTNWLLNVRGGDVPYTPFALCFAIIHADCSLEWFVDSRKLSPGVRENIGAYTQLHEPDTLGDALDNLGKAKKTVRVDTSVAPAWAFDKLKDAGAVINVGDDPCQLAKAKKNVVQIEGMRKAHRRDGVSLIRFLAWLDNQSENTKISELDVVNKLEEFRHNNEYYQGPSFTTIAGSGPNGAIVHYRVTPETDRTLVNGDLLLIDSGGQYLDGTTDVTRTIVIGTPTPEMRERWTLVLKGHIALAEARFPPGTFGSQLDILARHSLWRQGFDYDHGTGHGVGSFLSVHEGPQRISKTANRVGLEPGMVISNEPGLYFTDAYGIRIENLITVIKLPRPDGAHHDVYGFETLTLVPLDRKLIELNMLEDKEIEWVDKYHVRVREAVGPLISPDLQDWLLKATASLRS